MAELVGIVSSFVGPAIELGKYIIAPIKRQFNYLCCFNSNIESLREEAKKLDDARVGLQMRVEAAENNAQVIFPAVMNWLRSATSEIEANLIEIENEIPKAKSSFFTTKSRFSLSKKARKTAEAMKELREHCDFTQISQPTPPLAKTPNPFPLPTYEFVSRKQIEENIMETMRENEVNIMGICGMGGVGKTVMAKRIMNRVKEEHLFDEVAMSVVSQQVDMMKIQHQIAEYLGLTLEGETLPVRAHQLRARLKGTKKILVVLDDVWERLKLEDLGLIPHESGVEWHCRILLTSRRKDVLNAMCVQNFFVIETLSKEEAWSLFREQIGNWVDNSNLLSIAKQVANECRGLPIALITVGSALKDNKERSIWEDALQQLKDSNPEDMPDVITEVYNPLKLSYDFLKNKNARSLFLLCCLFPEDFDISLEHLTLYCMGLRFFGEIRSVELVRNKVFALVKMLQNRFLLQEGNWRGNIRMHDVVRDVANYIASNEQYINLNLQKLSWSSDQYSYSDCKWLSMFPREESEVPNPIGYDFPNLGLFMIHGQYQHKLEIEDFFEGMKGLNVCSLKFISSKSLQPTIKSLKNLRTLHLNDCDLESISVVGELLSLEILSCDSCDHIKELPFEIGKLNHLKLLEFSRCKNLRTIVPGIMSNLVALEELKMIYSFGEWASASEVGKERSKNAPLSELQSLSNLRCLEIEVEDYTLAVEEIHFPSKLVKRNIAINGSYKSTSYEKNMIISLPREIAIGNWVQDFLRDTEFLGLDGDGSNILDISQAHNIKALEFSSCSTIKDLVNTTWRGFDVFPVLESMWLYDLPNLQAICQGPIPDESFKNLRDFEPLGLPEITTSRKSPNQNILFTNLSSLSISACGKLLNLFPLTMLGNLLQLEDLTVEECEMMEELFSNDGSGIKTHITMPKLKSLTLYRLQNLTAFCRGIESIDFPMLISMSISECPKLRISIFSSLNYKNLGDGHGHNVDAHDDSFHLFNNFKVCLPIIKKLHLESLDVKININTEECVCDDKGGFLKLEALTIFQCETMEQVFLNEEDECHDQYHLKFPKLKSLLLFYLPNLTTFSKGIEIIDFPVLSRLKIQKCPKLTSIVSPMGAYGHDDYTFHLFCNSKVTFGSLEELKIGRCSSISNIWCDQIPNGFFTGLKDLEILGCDNIRSLFSPGVARNLVNLTLVKIVSCKEMVKVIEVEVEADKKEIISGTCPSLMLFPKLQELRLSRLPKLGTICKWRCEIELPELKNVIIDECPQMEMFTMGSLRTPRLTQVFLDCISTGSVELNGILQLHFRDKYNVQITWQFDEELESTPTDGTASEELEIEENVEEKF